MLTPKRLELLQVVHREPAPSVKALATRLHRDYKRVHEDVETLSGAGLLSGRVLGAFITAIKSGFHGNSRLGSQSRLGRAMLLAAFLCAPALAAHAMDRISSRQLREIKQLSANVLSKDALPGLSIAVAKGNQVWSAGFGHADLEQDVAVDSRSLFRTASISKWLTATAALRLVDDGKLALDAGMSGITEDDSLAIIPQSSTLSMMQTSSCSV